MSLFDSMSRAYMELVKQGARANHAQIVQAILDEGARWKPAGYDSNQRRRRDHYQGRGAYWVREKLKSLFPKSYDSIPILSYNWAKMHADIAAAVYDEQPQRQLIDDAGEVLPDDDARVIAFNDLLADSEIATQLPEAERRMQWTHTVVLSVRWRRAFDEATNGLTGRVCLDLHWPHDVWIVPHPSSPTDIRMALAVMVRVSGASGITSNEKDEWFELWTRGSEEDELGNPVRFDPWMVSLVNRSGDGVFGANAVQYAGTRLPFLLLRLSSPEGCPWVDAGDDDVNLVEMLNVDLSDEAYIAHLQGHTDKVYRGSRFEASQMVGGPDKVIKIDTGEDLNALDYNPKLQELRTANQQRLKLWAMTKRHSQDAYTIDASAPQSGISRQIANEPQEKMRREQVVKLKAFEEQELLPTMVDVFNIFSAEPSIEGVGYLMTPATPSSYEEPESTQRRALEAKDAGLITEARAAVEAGWYSSVDEAVAAGLSNELAKAAPIGAPQATARTAFGQRLLSGMAATDGA